MIDCFPLKNMKVYTLKPASAKQKNPE